jgi:hypothetical protein
MNNAFLWQVPEWKDETGMRWFLENIPASWKVQLHTNPIPGIAIVSVAK